MRSADQEGLDFGQVSEYLDPAKSLSKLPLDSLFLVGKPVPALPELELRPFSTPPEGWKQGLKERQAMGVSSSIKHKLCAIHGPPGTGKRHVASRIILCLLQISLDEKIPCSAPANVALDSLTLRCIKLCTSRGMANLPFVRVWSVSQTKAQYSSGESDLLNDPYHIETLRVNLARRHERRFARYLEGHVVLRDHGVINDVKLHDDWNKATTTLTRMVMGDARVVFCTTASLASPVLKWKGSGGETMTWEDGPRVGTLDILATPKVIEIRVTSARNPATASRVRG